MIMTIHKIGESHGLWLASLMSAYFMSAYLASVSIYPGIPFLSMAASKLTAAVLDEL